MTAVRKRRTVKSALTSAGDALTAIAARFRAEFPEEWEALRLCPLQHGLEDMARLLK
jgi:hypothetical protein